MLRYLTIVVHIMLNSGKQIAKVSFFCANSEVHWAMLTFSGGNSEVHLIGLYDAVACRV